LCVRGSQGPEIRTGKLIDGLPVQLARNQEFTLTTDESVLGDSTRVSVAYSNLPHVVKAGTHILIDDGLIDLLVLESLPALGEIRTRVMNPGVLGGTKGVNLPGVVVDLPSVTQKDVSDIRFGLEQGVDFIAASFVRKASDVLTIRKILGAKGAQVKIISKIENQEGLDNFEAIAAVSDGIMVARGDLGVEIPIEHVALAQKMMIRHCNMVSEKEAVGIEGE
jgi:pyruvate kinase